ncbi:hypothetical protein TWF506_011428 [Arthrobotrys conoides]|uniref:Peptidase S8/S53 domain-containing protein n=1 Tax=Arthrobotrys conoides TaxID=74498 RepID=A0AAN8RP13_9PEZI
MAQLSALGSSTSVRYSAQTAAFLAQLFFASGVCAAQPTFETYHSPVNSSSPIYNQNDSQNVEDMAATYLASGIVVLSLIAAFYRKNSTPTLTPHKVIRTFRPRPNAKSLHRPRRHNLFQLETLDYRRPDHSDKITYWELYQQNCLEPFLPTEIAPDDNFLTNVLLIDSGIDVTHQAIGIQRDDGLIQPWRDYTTGNPDGTSDISTSLEDEIGHGTIGANILGNIAKSAVIYSARVAKGSVNDVDPKVVAQAINDAIDNNRGINFQFIIMPLGFPEHTQGLNLLEEAIQRAYRNGITLIAAAGNEGNCRNPPPPACYPEVICALSCDGNGTPSGFSPSIQIDAKEKREFLVPGEGIECAWIEPGICHRQQRFHAAEPLGPEVKGGFTYVSGTSFACSVLGAISIVVLERLYEIAMDDEKLNSDPAKLKNVLEIVRKDYLREILGHMERPERRAYLLVPTQATDGMLEGYLRLAEVDLEVSSALETTIF